jgi:type II secretory ATPase GspE/PulE/Tfp pilus assembly ATPase PilB-like protein
VSLLEVVDPASVANMILQRAFDYRVTDIHLDPVPAGVRVRFRIDGMLQDILPIPMAKAIVLISRLKVMAGMDIAERRLPQDGAIPAGPEYGVPRDIRVGSSPTVNGERLVLRLMPDPEDLKDLESLGFFEDQLAEVRQLLKVPYGLVLVVGPVGSGKSTTVYSLLRELNSSEKSVVTIEDPVERRLPGVNQIQVDARTHLSFVTALRGTLRQDPNIICIGEIRDAETAQIACRAATTGVLVLSTLHANNTASAVDVLRSCGISSMTIADCLRGVISQRLIRRICRQSQEEYAAGDSDRQLLNLPADSGVTLARGVPAPVNFNTGYSGRTAVFESMLVSAPVRDAINRGEPAWRIREIAEDGGMVTLERSTERHVLEKRTSVLEFRRVVSDTELHRAVSGTPSVQLNQ